MCFSMYLQGKDAELGENADMLQMESGHVLAPATREV